MNKTLMIVLCGLALVGAAGAAEAHVTYYDPVAGECDDLPGPHNDTVSDLQHEHLGAPDCSGGH